MSNSRCLRTAVRIMRPQRKTSPWTKAGLGSEAMLLPVPDGFEGVALGTWCPVCGSRAGEGDFVLAVLEASVAQGGAIHWMVAVHPQCIRPTGGV
jgi:hypothetical protein